MNSSKAMRYLSDAEIVALVTSHERLVSWCANRVMRGIHNFSQREEVENAARYWLVRSALNYNPGAGVKFITYATYCMLWSAYYQNRQDRRNGIKVPKRLEKELGLGWKIASLSEPSKSPLSRYGETLADDIPDRDDLTPPKPDEEVWREVAKMLDPKDAEVLVLHYRDGLTLREIGERTGVSWQRVYQRIGRARAKLRLRPDRVWALLSV